MPSEVPKMYRLSVVLKKAMDEQGVTVNELSKKANISEGLIYGYLTDRINPTIANIQRIAKTLDLDGNEVLDLKPKTKITFDTGMICRGYCKYYPMHTLSENECSKCKIKSRL
jgi:transcriptional regulator with XRE-family HTH domain